MTAQSRHLLILLHVGRPRTWTGEVITFETLLGWVHGGLGPHVLRYEGVGLRVHRMELIARPFMVKALLRVLSRGACWLEDETDKRREITLTGLTLHLLRWMGELPGRVRTVRGLQERLAALTQSSGPRDGAIRGEGAPIYLRTDLWFGVQSGGSVSHIAGVLNHLGGHGAGPIFFSTDRIPTVDPGVETHIIQPGPEYQDFLEIPAMHFNETLVGQVRRCLGRRVPGFVYQRYSAFNVSGLELAREYGVPLVLEYNGSEVWINRHWGRPFRHEGLAEQVERANLEGADLIVVVSRVIRDQLVTSGIGVEKILVNPNGADPERFSPALDGGAIRHRLGLEGKIIIGFIGTFGRWHGAEVLVEALGLLLAHDAELRGRLHLLLIGDGLMRPAVEERVSTLGLGASVTLTGLVPQHQGPEYLAAADILAAPHVPNPDATPFFGSPTKVFEYMAMGKGIVASRLGQMEEILEDERTALLVTPGDPQALMRGLHRLARDGALSQRLGLAARAELERCYTWAAHTRRIVTALDGCSAQRVGEPT